MHLFPEQRVTDTENKPVVTKQERVGKGRDQEAGINIYTLQYTKQITNKHLYCIAEGTILSVM